ncbi:hypothetical protein C1H46_033185 [Malus baccata]|uniref:Uncharacterized protein n=1 Tax=Malus baccata TaxID=106549 RepID=A0A540L448_MALBA|nr:hypothetical protein C1H46_033185 [Malus baccata]
MFRSRVVGLFLKNNGKAMYNLRGTTPSRFLSKESFRLLSTGITRKCLDGFRSLPKGNYVPSIRNMSTVASVGIQNKEGWKLLVNGGPHAQKMVGIWLLGSPAWVFSKVILGDEDWLLEFEKYKQSPDVNRGMGTEDFKFIYWMEYAHRMWGRALGIMFALAFSHFLRKGYITLQLGARLSTLFALGAGQGLIGWWMVKSGLERLAAHLTSAFAIYCGLLWTGLSVVMPEPPAELLSWVRGAAKVKRLALPVILLVGVTAVSGAFVAGNDAVCNFVPILAFHSELNG